MVALVGDTAVSGTTLEWLLEPSHPSVRYLALTKVLGWDQNGPKVRPIREAIPETGPARDILLAQYPQGYWMHPGIGYSPRYRATIWQPLILAQLGMARCDRLDRAVDQLFRENQTTDGAFRASRRPGDTPLGLHAAILWSLERLGYGSVPEVSRAWSWLVSALEAEGSTAAGGLSVSTSSLVQVLWAANAVPTQRRDDGVQAIIRSAAASLLENAPRRGESDPRWFRLTFPLLETPDLLHWIGVLVEAGQAGDPRLSAAVTWLAEQRGDDGAWPLERAEGKLWADFGELEKPNKWVTVRALAVDARLAMAVS